MLICKKSQKYFKFHPTYPNLKISTDGYYKGPKSKDWMKGTLQDGYRRFHLPGARKTKTLRIHICVAETHIGEKPFVNAQVNHKDHNRDNNHLDNLEWTSPSENSKHASALRKKKYAYSKEPRLNNYYINRFLKVI